MHKPVDGAEALAFPDMRARCRDCGTMRYHASELTLHEGQEWRCYRCFDDARRTALETRNG